MKDEIREGVEFLRQFLAKYGQLTQTQIDDFAHRLTNLLEERYVNHWYEENPMKGQAFRCLRLKRSENYMDPVLDKILKETKLNLNQLGLPNDFTLWIDPGEVTVRFGDQVGYTYSIARLNKSSTQSNVSSPSSSSSQLNDAKSDSKDDRRTLIVENSAKIFDEKLTAFIRQNSSCTNTNPTTLDKTDTKEDDLDFNLDTNTDLIVDKLVSLSSSDQKSLPQQQSTLTSTTHSCVVGGQTKKRTNSSNIAISNNDQSLGINAGLIPPNNRLSYNDSCYYSSSSSSCASSFGSNNNDELQILANNKNNLSWLTKPADTGAFGLANLNNASSSSSFFDTATFDNTFQTQIPFMGPASGQQSQLLTRNNSFGFYNSNSMIPFGGSFENFNTIGNNAGFASSLTSSTLNSINPNPFMNSSVNAANNSFYSETSSDRSDTPNSCASFFMAPSPSSSSSFLNNNNNNNNSFSSNSFSNSFYENLLQNYDFSSNSVNMSGTGLGASLIDQSTSTSLSTQQKIHTKNDELIIDESKKHKININDLSKTPTKATSDEEQEQNSSKLIATSPTDSVKSNKSESNKKSNGKKDDSYCGYVESFPYYYKLNRLYNALAVQKMQAERLRKSALLNNSPNPGNANNAAAIAAALAALQSNPNANLPLQRGPKTGTSPGTSVGSNRLSMLPSPASSPSNFLPATPPPPPSAQTSQPLMNAQFNQQKQFQANKPSLFGSSPTSSASLSPSSQIKSIINNNGNNKNNGYPLSPTNAAISFANHQNSKYKSNSYQHHRQNSNNTNQSFNLNPSNNKLFDNSQLMMNLNTNNNNNNGSLFQSSLIQQQQQIPQQLQSPQQFQHQQLTIQQQQQQIMNLFGQMNLNRGQDLLKTGN